MKYYDPKTMATGDVVALTTHRDEQVQLGARQYWKYYYLGDEIQMDS